MSFLYTAFRCSGCSCFSTCKLAKGVVESTFEVAGEPCFLKPMYASAILFGSFQVCPSKMQDVPVSS